MAMAMAVAHLFPAVGVVVGCISATDASIKQAGSRQQAASMQSMNYDDSMTV